MRTALYEVWCNMRRRCTEPTNKCYARYGERGIKVCAEWSSFEQFAADVGEIPEGKTLERVDNDGDYVPENVVWATPKEQANNRSTNVYLTIDGVSKTTAEWADFYGLDVTGYKRAHERMKNGWEPKRAFETPARVGKYNAHKRES